jgi:hypothetical protein
MMLFFSVVTESNRLPVCLVCVCERERETSKVAGFWQQVSALHDKQ